MDQAARHRRPVSVFVFATTLATLSLLCVRAGNTAELIATVLDQSGKPLPDAVVLVEAADAATIIPPSEPSADAVIDQKDETYIPMVVAIRPGGQVRFHNSDNTRHHVYSFSKIHRFEFVQKPGETSAPERFDTVGTAAIGCNIHDSMAAYVFVTNAPRAIVTDLNGKADITNLPAGKFRATIWHPYLRTQSTPPAQEVALADAGTTIAVTISVLPPRQRDPNSLY